MSEESMSQSEITLRCNDADLFCRVQGEGPALLLLHGFFGTGGMWDPYLPLLSDHFRLVIPDLRGHGRSTNPSGRFTHRQAALDVYALLDQLNIDAFLAAGTSTGGMTLLHMATQQPGRVQAMVLICATSYFPEQCRAICRSTTMPDESNPMLADLRRSHVRGDDQIQTLCEQFRGFASSYDDMNFTPPYLSTITARTLILHGDRDEFFPVDIPVGMYRAIPNAALSIVPNAGHDLYVLWPKPLAVLPERPDLVVEFLKR